MNSIIKNDKYDNLFSNAIFINFFVYLFFIELAESSLFEIELFNLIIKNVIRFTFVIPFAKAFYSIFRGKWSNKELLIYSLIGILVLIVKIKSGYSILLLALIYNMAFKDEDYEKVFLWAFYALLISFCIIIASGFNKAIPDHSISAIRYGIRRVRYNLGFFDHVGPHTYFSSIVIMFFLSNKSITKCSLLFVFFLNVLLFMFTDSKNHFLCILLLVIIYWQLISKNNRALFNAIYKYTIISPLLYIGMTLLFVLLYKLGLPYMDKINNMLTGRLALSLSAFQKWDISLFGQITNMGDKSGVYQFVDSSYLNILFNLGILSLIGIVLFYILFTKIAYYSKNDILVLVLFISLLNGLLDATLYFISYRPFIVVFASILNYYSNRKVVL